MGERVAPRLGAPGGVRALRAFGQGLWADPARLRPEVRPNCTQVPVWIADSG